MNYDYGTIALTEPVGSIREHVPIAAPPSAAWARIADIENNNLWFTDIAKSWCEIDTNTGRLIRKVQMATGMTFIEDIIRVDAVQRRLQYRIRSVAFLKSHLATIDVIDTTALTTTPSCMVVYSIELDPGTICLPFGAASFRALTTLKEQIEDAQGVERADGQETNL